MKNILKILFLILIILGIYIITKPKLSFGTFTNIPENLKDSGCTFYWTEQDVSNKNYALVSTFGNTENLEPNAIIFINNKLEELNTKDSDYLYKYKYENSKYAINIKVIRSTLNGNESYYEEGILTAKDNKGNSILRNIIGYCGV
ncbi:MAG: hypothetical protein WC795_00525 [Candidatus Paceibacterota bacterium]|jgi:hypothetical protein